LGLSPVGRMRLGQKKEQLKGVEDLPPELRDDANDAGA